MGFSIIKIILDCIHRVFKITNPGKNYCTSWVGNSQYAMDTIQYVYIVAMIIVTEVCIHCIVHLFLVA